MEALFSCSTINHERCINVMRHKQPTELVNDTNHNSLRIEKRKIKEKGRSGSDEEKFCVFLCGSLYQAQIMTMTMDFADIKGLIVRHEMGI